jgi:hypothetical protein
MTLPRAYAPIFPEFDAFLFASVGEEVDGVPLSVLSALARLGLDPREEAARLAHLTKEAAVDQLARMIARLYDQRWSASEAWRIASGLIERLPMMGGAAAKDDRAAPGSRFTIGFRSPSFLIYLALALAMLVSLIASGYLSLGG